MLCAPDLLLNSRLVAHAWSLGSSPASKAAQAALDSPKWDCKRWDFHRANMQQPTGANQHQSRHSLQLTHFVIIPFASKYVKDILLPFNFPSEL